MKTKSFDFLETQRLLLRLTTVADARLIFEKLNMPKFLRYVGDRNVHSVGEARIYIEQKIRPQIERLGYGSYTMIRKSDGVKIGTCGLYDRPGVEGIDLGFGLLPPFEGQGFGSESSRRLIAAAFQDFRLPSLKAVTVMENYASQKLLEKLCFERIGTLRLPGTAENVLLFERLAEVG